MAFSHKYNTDDVFIRSVIVGFVNLLNKEIKIQNVLSDDKSQTVEIPWFFDQSGDEDFMQDYFTEWSDCVHPKLTDGNYDVIPRGVLTLGGVGITPSDLTNKYVRGSYVKEVNGVLQTFNSFVRQIPLTISFNAEIKTDTLIDSMKITQAIIETFYSTQVFRTSYKGFMISCQVGFPDDYDIENLTEYSYDEGEEKSMDLQFNIETYLPVINQPKEIHSSKKMTSIGNEINVKTEDPRKITLLNPPVDSEDEIVFYDGTTAMLEWSSIGNVKTVNIDYTLDNNEWIPIARNIYNNGFYNWNITEFYIDRPEIFYNQKHKQKDPAILIPIVGNDKKIKDVIIQYGGNGYDNNLEIDIFQRGAENAKVIPGVVEGKIVEIKPNNIVEPGSNFTIPDSKNIKIKVSDVKNPDVYSISENIYIK